MIGGRGRGHRGSSGPHPPGFAGGRLGLGGERVRPHARQASERPGPGDRKAPHRRRLECDHHHRSVAGEPAESGRRVRRELDRRRRAQRHHHSRPGARRALPDGRRRRRRRPEGRRRRAGLPLRRDPHLRLDQAAAEARRGEGHPGRVRNRPACRSGRSARSSRWLRRAPTAAPTRCRCGRATRATASRSGTRCCRTPGRGSRSGRCCPASGSFPGRRSSGISPPSCASASARRASTCA